MFAERDFEKLNTYLMALFGLNRLRREDDQICLETFCVIFPQIRSEFMRLQELLPERIYPIEKRMMLWLGEALVVTKCSSVTDQMIKTYLQVCDDLECWIIAGLSLNVDYLILWQTKLFFVGFDAGVSSYLYEFEIREGIMSQIQRCLDDMIVRLRVLSATLLGGIGNVMEQASALMRCLDGLRTLHLEFTHASSEQNLCVMASMIRALDETLPSSLTPSMIDSLIQELEFFKGKLREGSFSQEDVVALDLRLLNDYGFMSKRPTKQVVVQA